MRRRVVGRLANRTGNDALPKPATAPSNGRRNGRNYARSKCPTHADKVIRLPLTRHVRLADADRATPWHPVEELRVQDREGWRRIGGTTTEHGLAVR